MRVKKLLMSVVSVIIISILLMPDTTFAANSTAPENFVKPSKIYTKSDVKVDNPVGLVVHDNPSDPLKKTTAALSITSTELFDARAGLFATGAGISATRATLAPSSAANVIYGPYTSLYLDDSKMKIIFSSLRQQNVNTIVVYKGIHCFKFKSGNNIIYLASSLLTTKPISGVCASLTNDLTSYANKQKEDWLYTTVYKSYPYKYNGNTIYRTCFARIGVKFFYFSDTEINMNTVVEDSIGFDVWSDFIDDTIVYPSDLNIKPTNGVKITNTGKNNSIYLGGYRMTGVGGDTTNTSIGKLIKIGYETSKTIGSIASGLTVATMYDLYKKAVDLTKKNGTRKTYSTISESLSDPSNKKYAYECTTKAPFNLRLKGDNWSFIIGTKGKPVPSTTYWISNTFELNW